MFAPCLITTCRAVHAALQMWHEPGAACWEPVFVGRPGATAEDSGVLLSTLTQVWVVAAGRGRHERSTHPTPRPPTPEYQLPSCAAHTAVHTSA